ncbi:hypothetical protein GmHk_13G036255 [Glycine max]|nr:hypothetical protein GmHk_13G036255 [Glycine max]
MASNSGIFPCLPLSAFIDPSHGRQHSCSYPFLSCLEEAVTLLTQNHNTLTTTQTSLHSRLDEVISHLQALEASSPSHSPRPSPPCMNLDIPSFDGTNALTWKIPQLIRKIKFE